MADEVSTPAEIKPRPGSRAERIRRLLAYKVPSRVVAEVLGEAPSYVTWVQWQRRSLDHRRHYEANRKRVLQQRRTEEAGGL